MDDARLQDEDARLAALRRLDVLDSPVEEPFENIVTLVRTVLAVPMATVTLVDRHRQWFKAARGFDGRETQRSVSFCTHTIQQRDPLMVSDAAADPRFAASPLVVNPPHVRSYLGVPLRTPDGYNVGAVCAMDTRVRDFSPVEVAILKNLANIAYGELELRTIAQVDHLTGALSRRAFLEQTEKELARARRYKRPSTLVMLDVDHFKRINDAHGHAAGDQVLREIAKIAEVALRPSDIFGRLGGEEFALLLPETDGDEGMAVAERLRQAISAHAHAVAGAHQLRVSVSLGLAELDAELTSASAWIEAADAMLYVAKEGGRDCVRRRSRVNA